MTLVALGSVKGSPGVTTVCVGAAARWPGGEQPVVVECDPAGGDLLARWRLDLSPGLVSLAAAARRTVTPGLIWQHTQRLPGGLPIVTGPAGAPQARAALAEITSGDDGGVLRQAADRAGTVVLADCGRLAPDSPALPVVKDADVVLLLARARDDALAHLVTWWPEAVRWSSRLCVVLVGDGYPTAEITRELGVPVTARLPDDAKGAHLLCGQPSRSSLSRTPYGRAAGELAAQIRALAHAAHQPAQVYRLPGTEPPEDHLRPISWNQESAAPSGGGPR